LTTQYLDEADQLAARIAIVDRGRTIATGTPAELKRRVGGSVIELRTERREQLASAAAALGRFGDGPPQVDEATRRVSVGVSGDGSLPDALRALAAAGVPVVDLALRQPTLDEVFLALTGHGADQIDPEPRAEALAA
jgi:ABC-2 type transport system ATP-binding protein